MNPRMTHPSPSMPTSWSTSRLRLPFSSRSTFLPVLEYLPDPIDQETSRMAKGRSRLEHLLLNWPLPLYIFHRSYSLEPLSIIYSFGTSLESVRWVFFLSSHYYSLISFCKTNLPMTTITTSVISAVLFHLHAPIHVISLDCLIVLLSLWSSHWLKCNSQSSYLLFDSWISTHTQPFNLQTSFAIFTTWIILLSLSFILTANDAVLPIMPIMIMMMQHREETDKHKLCLSFLLLLSVPDSSSSWRASQNPTSLRVRILHWEIESLARLHACSSLMCPEVLLHQKESRADVTLTRPTFSWLFPSSVTSSCRHSSSCLSLFCAKARCSCYREHSFKLLQVTSNVCMCVLVIFSTFCSRSLPFLWIEFEFLYYSALIIKSADLLVVSFHVFFILLSRTLIPFLVQNDIRG